LRAFPPRIARDSPLRFGISFSRVGGPANAPRKIARSRLLVSRHSDCFICGAYAMTKLMGERQFTKTDRFFQMAEYITVYLDMETYAVWAAKRLPLKPEIKPPGNYFATLKSRQFPVRIRHHVFGPFPDSFDKPRDAYAFNIVPAAPAGDEIRLESAAWGDVGNMFWNNALIFFYEQYRPWLQTKFGAGEKDRNTWPQIFRFAWALRNAAAHHNGALNITEKNVPPIVWHHLSYDYRHAGTHVHPDVINLTDMLILLIEMSDELDQLGAPHP